MRVGGCRDSVVAAVSANAGVVAGRCRGEMGGGLAIQSDEQEGSVHQSRTVWHQEERRGNRQLCLTGRFVAGVQRRRSGGRSNRGIRGGGQSPPEERERERGGGVHHQTPQKNQNGQARYASIDPIHHADTGRQAGTPIDAEQAGRLSSRMHLPNRTAPPLSLFSSSSDRKRRENTFIYLFVDCFSNGLHLPLLSCAKIFRVS